MQQLAVPVGSFSTQPDAIIDCDWADIDLVA